MKHRSAGSLFPWRLGVDVVALGRTPSGVRFGDGPIVRLRPLLEARGIGVARAGRILSPGASRPEAMEKIKELHPSLSMRAPQGNRPASAQQIRWQPCTSPTERPGAWKRRHRASRLVAALATALVLFWVPTPRFSASTAQ